MNQAEALKALDRIETLIDYFGGPNDEDHRDFKSQIFSLRSCSLQNPYFREKLSSLEQHANDGFSTRKFMNKPGSLQQVKVWALGDLSTARSLVEEHWPSK